MRGVLKLAMVLGMAGMLASLALAQFRGGFGGAAFLVNNPGVQKELKLSDDQITKVKDTLGKVRDNHKDDFAKFRDLSNEERQKLMAAISKENDKALGGILDAKQMKRLKEIDLQNRGATAFADPQVQTSLKLTADQKDKLKTINEDSTKKIRELFQGGFSEETQKKIAELRKQTMEKATEVLTADQKKSWKNMTGAPFEVKFERRRPKEG